MLGCRKHTALLTLALWLGAGASAWAQADSLLVRADTASTASAQAPRPTPTYTRGAGVSVWLTNDGFGLGSVTRLPLGDATSFLVDVSFQPAKDERERQFFGFFGESVILLKRNYVLLLPVHVGVEQRLFRSQIEDPFRPFVQATVGPTVAYQWPYFDDANGNGVRESGEGALGLFGGMRRGDLRLGLGGALAVGAYFGRSARATQGLRVGYQMTYFDTPLDFLEPRVSNPSRSYVGTPVVSLHLLRLW